MSDIHNKQQTLTVIKYIVVGLVPTELGEKDGRNAAAAVTGLVNGMQFILTFNHEFFVFYDISLNTYSLSRCTRERRILNRRKILCRVWKLRQCSPRTYHRISSSSHRLVRHIVFYDCAFHTRKFCTHTCYSCREARSRRPKID